MKSLFFRYFMTYSLIIVIGFAVLGGAFFVNLNIFTTDEKQNLLERTGERAGRQVASHLDYVEMFSAFPTVMKSVEQSFRLNMSQIATENDGLIFVTDLDGSLLYIANSEGTYAQQGGHFILELVEKVLTDGVYNGMSNLSGYLTSTHYIRGLEARSNQSGDIRALVFVTLPADRNIAFISNVRNVFFFIMTIVLLVTLVVTYFVARMTVKPLRQIAVACRSFARGDFSARLPVPERQDEIFDMTISFNAMAEAVENMEDLRRGLIANVSHDLRTPMTTIAGFIDGILDGTIKGEKQAYYLNIVSDEIKRLSRLASSMLDVSRLEAGQSALNKTTFDASEMIRRVVISFEQKLSKKNLNLELDIPDVMNIMADHDSMFQVIYNLFDNAVKYSNEGGEIKVIAFIKSGRMQFNCVNTGETIDPESLRHIFDRFYKVDKSRTRGVSGAGLGLYIVKMAVNRHNGDVFAKSENGQTEFGFSIPTA